MKQVDRLLSLLPPLTVTDPKEFISGAVATFARYPDEVMKAAVFAIASTSDRPTLRIMKQCLDDVSAPIDREWERQEAHRDHVAGLLTRPKRTPEQQARIDADVASFRMKFRAALVENDQPTR